MRPLNHCIVTAVASSRILKDRLERPAERHRLKAGGKLERPTPPSLPEYSARASCSKTGVMQQHRAPLLQATQTGSHEMRVLCSTCGMRSESAPMTETLR